MLPIPDYLLAQGVRDMVRISDARISGTSYGACVLHVAPEAFTGGPLALVQTRDPITLDVAARELSLKFPTGPGPSAANGGSLRRRSSNEATAPCTASTSPRPTRAATSASWPGAAAIQNPIRSNPPIPRRTRMSHEIDRRSLLRLGAASLAVPVLATGPPRRGWPGGRPTKHPPTGEALPPRTPLTWPPTGSSPRCGGPGSRPGTSPSPASAPSATALPRVKAGTVGGPLLLIQGTYNGQTGDFPPDVSAISLTDWTVGDCAGIWSITGASATDPVGTATLDHLTITTSTAANSAVDITNLVVKDVTVGGTPVTA